MSQFDQKVVGYARWLVRRRWWALAISVLVAFGLAAGGMFLGFDNDYRVFFGKQNPQLEAFEALQARYTKDDSILFVVAPQSGEVFEADVLAAIEDLTERAWRIPYSTRVDSITNFQHTYAEGDDLIVEDLVSDARGLGAEQLAAKRAIATSEPFLLWRLVPERAHVTAVNVTVKMPDGDVDAVPALAAFVRGLAAEIETAHPGVEIYLTGIAMLNNAFVESSMGDLATLVPLMYGILILTMALLFRSLAATVATVIVILLSTITAMGIAGWVGMNITPPSASAPTMIMTLAVADSIHLLITMLGEMRRGRSREDAIVESLRINLTPVFLTSLTTVIGFLSLNFSDAPPFRDLGNITAFGVAAAFVFSVVTLPAFMAIVPVRARVRETGRTTPMDRVAEFVIRGRTRLLVGMGVIVAGLVAFIPTLELNDRFVEYFDDEIRFRTDTDFTMENLSGIYRLDYSMEAGEDGGVSNPDYLQLIEDFAVWFRAQDGVVHVATLSDTMKRLNKNLHADDPDWYRLPDERNLAAQYLLLYEMSLPYGLDLNNQINVDKSATRFTVTLANISTREVRALDEKALAWLRENAPPEAQNAGTGTFKMFAYISERNINSMLLGTSIALVLISLSLIVFLRTVKFGLISLIPNLVPAGMAFGLWALIVGQANVAVSIVTAMSLGIVVDFTVHFLSKYLRARREQGGAPADAVRYAFNTVGMALWVTSLVLFAGFLVLSQSSFMINGWMGVLTAITIAFALIADFLLLPPILMLIDRTEPARLVKPAEA